MDVPNNYPVSRDIEDRTKWGQFRKGMGWRTQEMAETLKKEVGGNATRKQALGDMQEGILKRQQAGMRRTANREMARQYVRDNPEKPIKAKKLAPLRYRVELKATKDRGAGYNASRPKKAITRKRVSK